MESPLTWSAIIAALASIVTTVKFWMDLGATRQKTDDAVNSTQDAHQRIDLLAGQHADFRTQASREFATASDIADAERRFADAVTGLRTDFNNMAGRLDNLLATLIQRGQS